jgi:protocadherin-15
VDGKFSIGYRDAVVRTVVGLDRETTAAYTLVLEAIGTCQLPYISPVQSF